MKGVCADCGSGTSMLEHANRDGERVKLCPACRERENES